MPNYADLCGYVANPEATARIVAGFIYPHLAKDLPHVMSMRADRNIQLWEPLILTKPSWKRGAQGIGDCVSWGHELVATMLMAQQHVKGESQWVEEAATEAIYGLRVESGGDASWSDGWYGSAAAKAMQDYGIVLRLDYSKETGNQEHNLIKYSKDKAKDWGYYGCGGQRDSGKLDAIAKKFPCKGVTSVGSVEEAEAALEIGCPISICSNVGFGSMQRNSEGIVRKSGTWNHCMMIAGKKYIGGEPLFRIFQSWGTSCSGPDPDIKDAAVSACSWWATADDTNSILRQDDSYAFSRVEGFTQPAWDFDNNWLV